MPAPPKVEWLETHFSCGIYPNIPLIEKTVLLLSYPLSVLDSQPLCDGPCTVAALGGQARTGFLMSKVTTEGLGLEHLLEFLQAILSEEQLESLKLH